MSSSTVGSGPNFNNPHAMGVEPDGNILVADGGEPPARAATP